MKLLRMIAGGLFELRDVEMMLELMVVIVGELVVLANLG